MDRAPSRRRAVLVALACVLVLVGAVAAGRVASAWRADTRPALTAALASVPADTVVLGFTDWDRVRAGVGVDDARGRDVVTRSVLDDSREQLEAAVGFGVDDVAWEVYAQSDRAAVGVVGVRDTLDWDGVRAALAAGGWSGSGDRWSNDDTSLGGSGLSDVLAEVHLVPSHGVVVLGDAPGGVDEAVDVVEGRARSLASVRPVTDTAAVLAGSDAVLLQRGTLGCDAAAMPEGAAQEQARAAQQRAGELREVTVSGRAVTDRGGLGPDAQTMRFATTFEDVDVAREQARVRAALATGPFIGRTGQVEDTLRLTGTEVRGATAVLVMDHDPETDVFMTGTGPALFATC